MSKEALAQEAEFHQLLTQIDQMSPDVKNRISTALEPRVAKFNEEYATALKTQSQSGEDGDSKYIAYYKALNTVITVTIKENR